MRIIIILLSLVSSNAMAQSSACNLIRDDDMRYYCLAVTGGGESRCNLIRNQDKRYLCQAETGRTGACNLIRDNDIRRLCQAKFR
jgi:hypothetical protein